MKKGDSIASELIAGFKGLADTLESGADVGTKFDCYQLRLELKPESYTPSLVKRTRKLLGASQTIFATFLGVSASTVRQWEQGLGSPSPMACRFMDEIRQNPGYYVARLRKSLVQKRKRRKLV